MSVNSNKTALYKCVDICWNSTDADITHFIFNKSIKAVIHKIISTLKGWQTETKNYMSYVICLSIVHHIRILPIVTQVSFAYECAEGDCPSGAS